MVQNDFDSTKKSTRQKLIICEKPSVARQFAKALNVSGNNEGYIENDEWIITWAVGHLIGLAAPDAYEERYARWALEDLPIIPSKYKYEVISGVAKQFKIVRGLLQRADAIYNAGDSGREGEYIQRLIFNAAGIENKKKILRVWIDSQTDAEIKRGIREAKDESYYNNLSEAGYARAISDWLIGMNFTRALSKKFSYELNTSLGISDYKKMAKLNVGRVMTCVLGLVVDRENEIKNFKPVDYYKIDAELTGDSKAHWKAVEGSRYFNLDILYSPEGFKNKSDAEKLLSEFNNSKYLTVTETETKIEKKSAPLLYSLAELQSDCTKIFKISPDMTLEVAQSLYEKKMTTYPRTDARVLSSAVAKEIKANLDGLWNKGVQKGNIQEILNNRWYNGIENSRYCDDKKITDHYAIIPTGEVSLEGLSDLEEEIYQLIVRRFLSIFYPAAEYQKTSVVLTHENNEKFFASEKHLVNEGYLKVAGVPKKDEKDADANGDLTALKKGEKVNASYKMNTSTTQPPKRYTSGSMILAMENAGNLIEDEELRAQIKGSGIGTSATRAEVIKKLTEDVHHLNLDKKTQILTPTNIGYGVYNIVKRNSPRLLSPKMTASWEKGLSQIENGEITRKQYLEVLNKFVITTVEAIKAVEAKQGEYKKVESKEIGTCPICGGALLESEKAIYCKNRVKDEKKKGCHFVFAKTLGGKPLAREHIDRLISGRDTELITGIPNKAGTGTYDCYITLASDGKVSQKYPAEETSLKCPKCGKDMEKGKYSYQCSCGMSFYHTMSERLITEEEMTKLFTDMMIGPLEGFKSKEGNSYSAYLLFNGKDMFQIKSNISGRNISRDEVLSILENGKTDKLEGFKSQSGKEFSAILKLGKKGYVEFDFPDSDKNGSGKKTTKGKSTTTRGRKKGIGAYTKYGIK